MQKIFGKPLECENFYKKLLFAETKAIELIYFVVSRSGCKLYNLLKLLFFTTLIFKRLQNDEIRITYNIGLSEWTRAIKR